MSDTCATVDTAKHGRRYADEVKELAFQLWEMRCNQNASEVSRLLATDEFGNLDVSRRTVQRWADEDEWESESARRFEAIFPGIHHRLFRGLVYAAVEGEPYLQDAAAGRVPTDKARSQMILGILDRVGFSPVGKGLPAVTAPTVETERPRESLAGKSPDELMRLEEEARRAGRKRS